MDISNVNIQRPQNPVFLDRIVWQLIDQLSLLSYTDTGATNRTWFAKLFPLAELNDQDIPAFYSTYSNEYTALTPTDKVKSYGFFIEDAPRSEVNPQIYNASISFYTFFNEKQLSGDLNRLQEHFITAVLPVLRRDPRLSNLRVYTQVLDVFSVFKIKEIEPTLRPFNAVRYTFDVELHEDCNNSFNPAPPIC